MSTIARLVTAPQHLAWWEWCKIAGAAGLIATAASVLAGLDLPAAAVAALLHLAADYVSKRGDSGPQERAWTAPAGTRSYCWSLAPRGS